MRRTIHFRKIEWFGQPEDTSALLSAALAARPQPLDTRFVLGIERAEVRHRDEQAGDLLLHFSTQIPGARRGTTPNADAAPNGDLSEAVAPPQTEFTEREFALALRGDQVAYATLGLVHSTFVERCLRGLLRLQHGDELANRFNLTARADEEQLEKLLEEGVSYLDLGLSLPHVDAVQQVAGQPISIAGGISRSVVDAVSARFMADHDPDRIQALSQASARLVLKFRKNAPLENIQSLTELTRDAVADGAQFKIETRKGNHYSHETLLVRGHYNDPAPPHMLSYLLAWQELSEFLDGQDE
ncbi:MAG TPA: hypothetical protein VJS47_02645 [Rhizomicrobium sp.]|nr:hypothetical protein [Rhizomicrobium sp.]